MIFLARYWSQLVTGLCVGTLVWGMTHSVWEARYQAQRAKAERTIAEFAKAEAEARERAVYEYHRRVEGVAKAAEQYEKGLADGQARAAGVVSDLESGNRRLRREIAAYATERLSRDSTATGELSEAAQRGASLVGAAVGVGAECDATQAALIEAYEALRRAAP